MTEDAIQDVLESEGYEAFKKEYAEGNKPVHPVLWAIWEMVDKTRYSLGMGLSTISMSSYESALNLYGIEGIERLNYIKILQQMDLTKFNHEASKQSTKTAKAAKK